MSETNTAAPITPECALGRAVCEGNRNRCKGCGWARAEIARRMSALKETGLKLGEDGLYHLFIGTKGGTKP